MGDLPRGPTPQSSSLSSIPQTHRETLMLSCYGKRNAGDHIGKKYMFNKSRESLPHLVSPVQLVLKSVLQVQYSGPSFSCAATLPLSVSPVVPFWSLLQQSLPHLREAQEKGSAVSLVGIGGSAGIKSPLGQELVETWPTKTWQKRPGEHWRS